MSIEESLQDILRRLELRAGELSITPSVRDVGRVLSLGDGVVRVAGLPEVASGEIVIFENGTRGLVLDLDREVVGCILFGKETGIEAGSAVLRVGQLASTPVGNELLGRVIDPLGRPRDDGPPIETREWREVEQEAPAVLDREPVREPLLTGLKVIDAAIPIGRGQRELILGDRETGKTSIAIDALINQRQTGVICVYVSIGTKRSSVRRLLDEMAEHDSLGHSVIVVADASEPVSLQYLAPYAGCSIAEWFAYQGKAVLIVYDDLTKHADAYRAISLLLRRPPTREAYPGDIFYAHARLMERSFKLSAEHGGGSVTALPIIETQRGNFSGFIPTNLISMTDGQIYLDASLFAQGQLPPVDVGLSVSRVGGSAQPGPLREAAANLRVEQSQYEEVRAFTRFGTLLDESTQRQLARGERLAAVLRQREREPVSLPLELAEIWALKSGLLDDVEPSSIPDFEASLASVPEFAMRVAATAESADGVTAELADDLSRWIQQAKEAIQR